MYVEEGYRNLFDLNTEKIFFIFSINLHIYQFTEVQL